MVHAAAPPPCKKTRRTMQFIGVHYVAILGNVTCGSQHTVHGLPVCAMQDSASTSQDENLAYQTSTRIFHRTEYEGGHASIPAQSSNRNMRVMSSELQPMLMADDHTQCQEKPAGCMCCPTHLGMQPRRPLLVHPRASSAHPQACATCCTTKGLLEVMALKHSYCFADAQVLKGGG
jgi:hypothetical protein